MLKKRDYYVVLGVDRHADLTTIKKAYREKAMDLHPDKNPGDKFAEIQFRELNEAYAVLKHMQKREAYDRESDAFDDTPHDDDKKNQTTSPQFGQKKYDAKKNGRTFSLSHVFSYSSREIIDALKIFALIAIPFAVLVTALYATVDTLSHKKNNDHGVVISDSEKK